MVLDAAPLSQRTKGRDVVPFLEIMRGGSPAEILLARVSRRGSQGLSLRDAVAETGWTQARLNAALAGVRKEIVRAEGRLVASTIFASLVSQAVALVTAFQKSNPLSPGIGREVLREQLQSQSDISTAVVDLLIREKRLEAAGDQVRLPGSGIVMKDEEAESKNVIEHAFASAGLKVPALKDVLASLKVDRVRAQKIVTLLLRDKILVKTSEDLVFHRAALDDLRNTLQAEKAKSAKIDVARFKDLTGVSRKYAIPLLEYLDREHVTRRVGDERVIL